MSFMNPESSYNLTEKQAAAEIGISPRTLRRYRHDDVAPPYLYTPTKRAKYSRKDLKQWIEQQVVGGFMQDLRDGGVVSKKALHRGGVVTEEITDPLLKEMNEKARLALVD